MKNMKNKVIVILAALMLATLPACAQSGNNPEETTTKQPDISTTETTYADQPVDNTGEPTETTAAPSTDKSASDRKFTETDDKVVVIAAAANLRTDTIVSADTKYKEVTKGTELTRTGYDEEWYRIKLADVEGTYYIKASVVNLVTEETVLETPRTMYVISNSLTVRSSPDFNASNNRIGYLSKGAEILVVAEGDGWYRIEYKNDKNEYGDYAYVGANPKYTSTEKPEDTNQG